jgi:hypothetical protein
VLRKFRAFAQGICQILPWELVLLVYRQIYTIHSNTFSIEADEILISVRAMKTLTAYGVLKTFSYLCTG